MQSILIVITLILGSVTFTAPVDQQAMQPALYIHVSTGQTDQPVVTAIAETLAHTYENVLTLYGDESAETYPGFWHHPTLVLMAETVDGHTRLAITPYTSLPWPLEPAAISHYDFAFDVFPHETDAEDGALMVANGLAAYMLGDCITATAYFSKVLPLAERLSGVLQQPADFYLGNCALLNEDYATAEQHFDQTINRGLAGVAINARINRAWARTQLSTGYGYHDALATLIDAYIGNDSLSAQSEAVLRSRYGYALLQTNQFDAALAAIDEAITLQPNDPSLHVLRGQASIALFEWDNAFTDYSTAIEIDGTYPTPYYFRGVLHYSILQSGLTTRDEALADFRQYLHMAPNGIYADDAAAYVESIQEELDALSDD